MRHIERGRLKPARRGVLERLMTFAQAQPDRVPAFAQGLGQMQCVRRFAYIFARTVELENSKRT